MGYDFKENCKKNTVGITKESEATRTNIVRGM